MSSFGDELRNLIAKKAEQLDVAQMLRLRQIEEEMRKEHALGEAVAAVVRDVFQPLMTELYDALVAAGIFSNSEPSREAVLAQQAVDARLCTLSARSARAVYQIRLYAGATPEGRIAMAATAEVGERRAEVADRGGRTGQKPEVKAAWQEVFNTPDAADAADRPAPHKRPLVEIAPKSIAPDPASLAAEQWCRAALKKIAAACVEAERG